MSRYIDAEYNLHDLPCYYDFSDEELNAISTALKLIPTADILQWIPCDEQLPESEEKTYWICTDTEYQCQCRWTNVNHFWTDLTTDWHWNIFDYPQYSKVVAWMPLPEPWKGEYE